MNISKYIGIPFKDKGRTVEGLDCWGLLYLIFKEQFGIEIPSFVDDYPTSTNLKAVGALIEQNSHTWINIEQDVQKAGDVLLMRFFGHPVHVGILIDKRRMIHVLKGRNTCLQKIDQTMWQSRILGTYRHPSLVNI